MRTLPINRRWGCQYRMVATFNKFFTNCLDDVTHPPPQAMITRSRSTKHCWPQSTRCGGSREYGSGSKPRMNTTYRMPGLHLCGARDLAPYLLPTIILLHIMKSSLLPTIILLHIMKSSLLPTIILLHITTTKIVRWYRRFGWARPS